MIEKEGKCYGKLYYTFCTYGRLRTGRKHNETSTGFTYRHVGSDKQVKRDVLFIDAMAVDEAYRGKGIGHQMFDVVKQIAKEKQLDGIELQVNARNAKAKAMYESYGFTEKSINMELL